MSIFKKNIRKTIFCPHCLTEFNKEDICFRSSDASNMGEDLYITRYLKSFDNYKTNTQRNAPYIIPPKITGNINIDNKRIYNKDGIYSGYNDDRFGATYDKICPACHNDICQDLLSDMEIIKVSLVGSENSGKTTFLAKLFHTLINKTSIRRNATFVPDSLSCHNFIDKTVKPFIKDNSFPKKGNIDEIIDPLVMTCRFFDSKLHEKSSCITYFYDISGVGLDSPNYIEKYGRHLMCSDAIIDIVDGGKLFDGNKPQAMDQCLSIYKNLMIFKELFYNEIFYSGKNSKKSSVPYVIVASKCDLVQDCSKEAFFNKIGELYPNLKNLLMCLFKEVEFFPFSPFDDSNDLLADNPFLWILEKKKIVN